MTNLLVNLIVIYLCLTINSTKCQFGDRNYKDLVGKGAFDWCCLKCDGPHVMCPAALEQRRISRPKGCSSNGGNGAVMAFFSEDNLVESINQERNKFAENAAVSNMHYLRISNKLQVFAAQLAGYCNSIPSVCVDTADYKVRVLTFNVSNPVNVTMTMVVDHWTRGRLTYLEKYHNQFYMNYTSIDETDDYTLLMWGTTSEIGCAQAYYVNNTNSSYQITCLLGPGGNINGAPVWERGAPCSNCSTPEDWTRQEGYCRDFLCYAQLPQWPRDDERLAYCDSERPPVDRIYVHEPEKPYAKGVTVILRPRYICDPISAAGNPPSLRWFFLAAAALSLRK